jgi:hypothetical protein
MVLSPPVFAAVARWINAAVLVPTPAPLTWMVPLAIVKAEPLELFA